MKKKILSAVIAAVVLGGLVGVYLIASGGGQDIELPAFDPPHVYEWMPERRISNVRGFSISRPDFSISFEQDHEENQFIVTSGAYVHIDQRLIRSMISELLTANITTRIEIDNLADAEQYGLYPPLSTVTVQYTDGEQDTVHIGNTSVDLNFHYVRIEGDDNSVYLVRRGIGERFHFGYDDIIDKTMHEITPEFLVNIQLLRRDQEEIYILPNFAEGTRQGAEVFFALSSGLMMHVPVGQRNIHVDNFLNLFFFPAMDIELGELVSLSIEDDVLERYGFNDPRMSLMFEEIVLGDFDDLRGERPMHRWRIFIGDNDPTGEYVYILYEGIPHIFKTPESAVIPVENIDFFRFIDRIVSLIQIWLVDEIQIEGSEPGQSFNIEMNHITAVGPGEHEFTPFV
ncbi:MAG: DUF4340 domain-containing protein, partial [Defluviitaleaceae bacterium]|nr:DUF4340 domain-containing protein [Defluviitaleaceae bacterium]